MLLLAVLAAAGCGSDGGSDEPAPERKAQAAYACMTKSEQRQYDAFASRLRRSIRRMGNADAEEIHRDGSVSALEDVMDSMLERASKRVGEACGRST